MSLSPKSESHHRRVRPTYEMKPEKAVAKPCNCLYDRIRETTGMASTAILFGGGGWGVGGYLKHCVNI